MVSICIALFLWTLSSFWPGVSTFLFGITLWALTYQRNWAEVARLMVAAACLLFLMGTMVCPFVKSNDVARRLPSHLQHVIFDAYHVFQGFISSDDTELFFADFSKITFKNTLNELETLFGDAILVAQLVVLWLTMTQLRRVRYTDATLYGSELTWSSSQL